MSYEMINPTKNIEKYKTLIIHKIYNFEKKTRLLYNPLDSTTYAFYYNLAKEKSSQTWESTIMQNQLEPMLTRYLRCYTARYLIYI